MRLRNKKTGEICDFKIIADYDDCTSGWRLEKHNGAVLFYDHIDEIHEDWEDYEEPKEYWFLSGRGEVKCIEDENTVFDKDHKSIGNYFSSREEAEKAVEKLKAWKRLKDFGCGFMIDDHFAVKFVGPDARKITSAEEQKSLSDAYKLLFGGEE